MSLLALLKACSHSQDIAGQANIEGPALEGRKGFYIGLIPPGYRIKLLSGGNSRAGCRIPAEFVGGSVLFFPSKEPLFFTLLMRGQVHVILFLNVPVISQHDLFMTCNFHVSASKCDSRVQPWQAKRK